MGARIVQIARDRDRGEVALNRLRSLTPHISHKSITPILN